MPKIMFFIILRFHDLRRHEKNSNVLMNSSLSYCHKSTFFWILVNLTLFEPETQIIRSANDVFSDFRFPRFSQTQKIWERPYKYLTFSFFKMYFFTSSAKFITFLGKHPGIPRKKNRHSYPLQDPWKTWFLPLNRRRVISSFSRLKWNTHASLD